MNPVAELVNQFVRKPQFEESMLNLNRDVGNSITYGRTRKNLNPALILGNVGLVYSLTKAGIPVYIGAEISKNPSFYSRLVKGRVLFSSYRTEKFIDELCEFGKTMDRKIVLFSDDDDALLTISQHREPLSEYYLFSFPPATVVEQVLDKQKFSKLAKKHRLPAPESYEVSSLLQLKEFAAQCTFPCIIKPVFRSDWYHQDFENVIGMPYKKAYKCTDMKVLIDLYEKISAVNPKVVLQEYIDGDDSCHYSVNLYADRNGQVRGHYITKKIRIYPIGAGMGTFISTIKDKDVYQKTVEIVQELNLCGLLNIQFKKDCRTGEPKLIEIHFRNSVWGYIGVAADMNLYDYYYQGLTSEELSPRKEYANVKYVDMRKDIAAFFQYRKAGELTFLKWLKSFKGKLVVGDFKATDPVPFLSICGMAMMGLISARWSSIRQ